jgi:hypothetical protein
MLLHYNYIIHSFDVVCWSRTEVLISVYFRVNLKMSSNSTTGVSNFDPGSNSCHYCS